MIGVFGLLKEKQVMCNIRNRTSQKPKPMTTDADLLFIPLLNFAKMMSTEQARTSWHKTHKIARMPFATPSFARLAKIRYSIIHSFTHSESAREPNESNTHYKKSALRNRAQVCKLYCKPRTTLLVRSLPIPSSSTIA